MSSTSLSIDFLYMASTLSILLINKWTHISLLSWVLSTLSSPSTEYPPHLADQMPYVVWLTGFLRPYHIRSLLGSTWNTEGRVGFALFTHHPHCVSGSATVLLAQPGLIVQPPVLWSMHIGQQPHHMSGFWWQGCRDANSSSTSRGLLN